MNTRTGSPQPANQPFAAYTTAQMRGEMTPSPRSSRSSSRSPGYIQSLIERWPHIKYDNLDENARLAMNNNDVAALSSVTEERTSLRDERSTRDVLVDLWFEHRISERLFNYLTRLCRRQNTFDFVAIIADHSLGMYRQPVEPDLIAIDLNTVESLHYLNDINSDMLAILKRRIRRRDSMCIESLRLFGPP